MNHLFTYGTLMFEEIWSRIVWGTYRSRTATIRGFIRKAVKEAEYPVIYRGPLGALVQGIVYLDVTPADIRRLDAFEGSYYARQQHPVTLTGGEVIDAGVYVLLDRYQHIASQRDWDPDQFRKNGLERFRNSYEGFSNANNSG